LDSLTLRGDVADLLKLAAKKPKVFDEDSLSDRSRRHVEVHEEHCVQISSFFVASKFLNPSRNENFGVIKQAEVFSSSNYR
jgi:hypothetical protein